MCFGLITMIYGEIKMFKMIMDTFICLCFIGVLIGFMAITRG